MEAICLQDILKDIASPDGDSMEHAAASKSPSLPASTETWKADNGHGLQDVNDWPPTQETPSLLFFTRMEERKQTPEYQRELSELLTRKFREFFP
jgi:hypothetical protein